jgi:hypothetical protein
MNHEFELVPSDPVVDDEPMRLFRPLLPLFRLWRLLLWPLLLSIALAAMAVIRVEPGYVVTASIQLINPAEVPPPRAERDPRKPREYYENPWTVYQDLGVLASAVGQVMESDATAEQFKAIGMRAIYKFTTHVSSEEVLPIGTRRDTIEIQVEGPNKAEAIAAGDLIVNRTKQVVDELQASYGTAEQFYITPQVVEEPGVPKVDLKRTVRAAVSVFVGGVSMTVFLGICVLQWRSILGRHYWRRRWAARKARREGHAPDEVAVVTTTSDDELLEDERVPAMVGAPAEAHAEQPQRHGSLPEGLADQVDLGDDDVPQAPWRSPRWADRTKGAAVSGPTRNGSVRSWGGE